MKRLQSSSSVSKGSVFCPDLERSSAESQMVWTEKNVDMTQSTFYPHVLSFYVRTLL